MMQSFPIRKVLCAKTFGSYYYEDVSSLQGLDVPEPERWFMPSHQPGFDRVKELAETLSVGLVGPSHVAWGDCVGVSYAGKSGRKGVFRHTPAKALVEAIIAPWLSQLKISSLRDFDQKWRAFETSQKTPFHPALSYGLSQAILALLAPDGALYRVIAREWNLNDKDLEALPLQGSSGNNRFDNADKMIVRKIAALPHSQVDHIPSQVGEGGKELLAYAKWLGERIRRFSIDNYRPIIHLDVHGAVGKVFQQRVDLISDFLAKMYEALGGLSLRIESVALAETLEDQIKLYDAIKRELFLRKIPVALVADEWANCFTDILRFAESGCVDMIHIKTPDVGSLVDIVDATLSCKKNGVGVLLGGSCVETFISTRSTIHLSMVTRPDMVLIKPGMGIDEGFMLCQGEMARIVEESRR